LSCANEICPKVKKIRGTFRSMKIRGEYYETGLRVIKRAGGHGILFEF